MTPAPLGAPASVGTLAPLRATEACRGQPAPSQCAWGKTKPCSVPLTPCFVPGSEVAGPGCPWGWGCSSLRCSRVGHLVKTHPPSSPTRTATPWLACRWVGGNTTWAALQRLSGLYGGHLHPTLVGASSCPLSTTSFLGFPQQGKVARWLVPQPAMAWEGLGRDNRVGERLCLHCGQHPWAPPLALQVAWQQCHGHLVTA